MKNSISLISLVLLSACNTAPTYQTGPNAEVSFDGLARVNNSRIGAAWIRPGIDLSTYDSLMLVGAGIEYRSVKDRGNLTASRSRADSFPLDARQRADIEATVQEVFAEELGEVEGFRVVQQAGPDTLALTGALIDVVSFVPPQPLGRTDYYLSELGEATLVLELSDSMSGQILARGVDGRRIDSTGIGESSRVNNRFELQNELRRWGTIIRNVLETLATTPILPAES